MKELAASSTQSMSRESRLRQKEAAIGYIGACWLYQNTPESLFKALIAIVLSRSFAQWPHMKIITIHSALLAESTAMRRAFRAADFKRRNAFFICERTDWITDIGEHLLDHFSIVRSPSIHLTSLRECKLLRDGLLLIHKMASLDEVNDIKALVMQHFEILMAIILPLHPLWPEAAHAFKYNGIACRNSPLRVDVNVSDAHYEYTGELRTTHLLLQKQIRVLLNRVSKEIHRHWFSWEREGDAFPTWNILTFGYMMSLGPHKDAQKLHWDYHEDVYRRNICTAFVPLVDVTENNSATLFHVYDQKFVSTAKQGDLILMDNIVWHCGTNHRDCTIRPLIYASFADRTTYEKSKIGSKTWHYNWNMHQPLPLGLPSSKIPLCESDGDTKVPPYLERLCKYREKLLKGSTTQI
ncbi:hypothetical protein IE077_002767 [Cardiosporidium cionae]|uniref:Phytanoyl-CoA dioxygenase n=1 Tax=Cardiosporidium cionae TaxID=476202 RepID=A0ABQ7J9Z0_9APIC|nr:hypothetical protein IE077_002767 [Cardiosporidium cionae]|eukprot:KAF8820823.1 hypothetical protein IE077_002767 [Cardiosporidium cionae]